MAGLECFLNPLHALTIFCFVTFYFSFLSFFFYFYANDFLERITCPRDGTIECPKGREGTIFRYPHGANLIPFESSSFSSRDISLDSSRALPSLFLFIFLSPFFPFYFAKDDTTVSPAVTGRFLDVYETRQLLTICGIAPLSVIAVHVVGILIRRCCDFFFFFLFSSNVEESREEDRCYRCYNMANSRKVLFEKFEFNLN